MKYLLSLDQGTTSSRAVLIDSKARIVASGQREFRQLFPEPGWVEHEPEAIWESQWQAVEEAMGKEGCGWDAIEAIGIANQRETVVAWNADTGEAVGNAIVWQDRRTAEFCAGLRKSGKEEWIQERTGLLLDPYFSGSKMNWILRSRSEAKELDEAGKLRFGTVDSWLVWKLSEGKAHITDVSNASRTQLMDIETCAWNPDLLEVFGVSEKSLPRIVDSSGSLAETSETLTGGRAIPISGIAGDQQAALFGQLCFKPGMVKCTYGTGCFILMQVGEEVARSSNRLLSTVAWRKNGKTEYAIEGSVFMGGACVQWLRDQLGIIETAADIETLAAESDSGGVTLVPAFTGLGAPHWDPDARGAVLGLTRGTARSHLARATLEAIALQIVDLVQAMESDSGRSLKEIRADGGASANDLLMQIQADFLGATVLRPKQLETTALGAGFLAGLGSGFWRSEAEIEAFVEADQSFDSEMEEGDREAARSRWRRAVEVCRSF